MGDGRMVEVEKSWRRRSEDKKRKKGFEATVLKCPSEGQSVAPDTSCNELHVCSQKSAY